MKYWIVVAAGVALASTPLGIRTAHSAQATQAAQPAAAAPGQVTSAQRDTMIRTLVARMELASYKSIIKGLTLFGDRREGTQRNRDAVDWIEAQLKSYGCTNTERITYEPSARGGGGGGGGGGGRAGRGAADTTGRAAAAGAAGRGAGAAAGAAVAGRAGAAGAAADTGARGRGAGAGAAGVAAAGAAGGGRGAGGGGGGRGAAAGPRLGAGGKGFGAATGVNNNPENQPNLALRELNSGPVLPGPRPVVFCTKIGTTRPQEMYIIGGHMDGIGWGEGANDNASGSAVVMEIARVLNMPGVETERSIRFALWNGEEGGLNGATAYVNQRRELQGIENPPGSGRYPEPKWMGMVQHDKMLWDHGAPRSDGTVSREQRPEADVNIEFMGSSAMALESQAMAWAFRLANFHFATHYPAAVGNKMQSTDSVPFAPWCPAISLRENERGEHVGSGWDPNWHQPTDVFTTYYDKDFLLGLNAAQTTLSAIARMAGVTVK